MPGGGACDGRGRGDGLHRHVRRAKGVGGRHGAGEGARSIHGGHCLPSIGEARGYAPSRRPRTSVRLSESSTQIHPSTTHPPTPLHSLQHSPRTRYSHNRHDVQGNPRLPRGKGNITSRHDWRMKRAAMSRRDACGGLCSRLRCGWRHLSSRTVSRCGS